MSYSLSFYLFWRYLLFLLFCLLENFFGAFRVSGSFFDLIIISLAASSFDEGIYPPSSCDSKCKASNGSIFLGLFKTKSSAFFSPPSVRLGECWQRLLENPLLSIFFSKTHVEKNCVLLPSTEKNFSWQNSHLTQQTNDKIITAIQLPQQKALLH